MRSAKIQRIRLAASDPTRLWLDRRQRSPNHAADGLVAPGALARANDTLRSPGQPLDAATRALMESRLGHDFRHVRVHTDARAAASAQALIARSYTLGANIVFAKGEYAPGSTSGQRLLAHELTHVVQQAGSKPPGMLRIGAVASAQEQEAERIAGRVGSGAQAAPSLTAPTGTIQREPPEWWRRFLENNRIDITVIAPGELPVVGTPQAGVRRNPDGTWTFVAGNEEHTVGADEIDDILGSFGRGPTTPGGPTGGRPLPTPVERFDPTRFVCPPGEYYDIFRLRCMREQPSLVPELTLPELRLPERPRLSLLNIESVTINHFALDSATIPAEAEGGLARLMELLNAHPDADVRVDGHTDSSGTEEHNEALGEARAEAVRSELVGRGVINPGRLRVRSFGKRILLNEERSSEERAQNRRVEVWFDLPAGEIAERFQFRVPEGVAPLLPRLTPPRLLGE